MVWRASRESQGIQEPLPQATQVPKATQASRVTLDASAGKENKGTVAFQEYTEQEALRERKEKMASVDSRALQDHQVPRDRREDLGRMALQDARDTLVAMARPVSMEPKEPQGKQGYLAERAPLETSVIVSKVDLAWLADLDLRASLGSKEDEDLEVPPAHQEPEATQAHKETWVFLAL